MLPAPILDLFDGQLPEFLPFEDYQRNYIELVLEHTAGKVSDKDGAAQILHMNPRHCSAK
ncbi:hypothetical protein [Neolewinella xylanilytica]|uniref:hypothetical protein n=1 Tax=Neolewinella xylanilytica TaxID=1514080 RepID=UPI0011B06150|nr:hypothetical protein [Neolewinella xylanilytica]